MAATPMTATALPTTAHRHRHSAPTPPTRALAARARGAAAGWPLIALLALSHGANDVVTGMLSALLPTLQRRFDLSESLLALLVATLAFSASLTQPLFGGLADRFGRARVAAAGTIVGAGVLSLLGIVQSLPLLFAVLTIGGLGSAAFHPAGTSLARAATADRRTLAVSAYSAGGTAGIALAPVVALGVVAHLGTAGTLWMMVPAVFSGLALLALGPAGAPADTRRIRVPRPLLRRPAAPALLRGPVGLLSLAELLSSLAVVTFTSAAPLWLVSERGVSPDSSLLGWTLTTFSLAAAAGGLLVGAVSTRVRPSLLVGGTRLLAPAPLFALFALEPGTAAYFGAVAAAGALLASGLPVLVVAAQDLSPRSAAAVSGMLMGFASGVAGVLYVGIGRLQETIGLSQAMGVAYLAVIPGAALAWTVLHRHRAKHDPPARGNLTTQLATALSCSCPQCVCSAAR